MEVEVVKTNVQVIACGDQKVFVLPGEVPPHPICSLVYDASGRRIAVEFFIMHFGSYARYNPPRYFGKYEQFEEIDSVCRLYRGGVCFDETVLYYFGSQSDGYHLFQPFKSIPIPKEYRGPLVYVNANWFEVGDELEFEYTPHPNVLKELQEAQV